MRKYKIFFLHGWLFDSRIWFGFEKLMPKIYQSVLIDLPGYGKNRDNLLSPVGYCKKIFNNLSSPTIIVGWSFGGILALLGLLKNYTNVEKIILINTHLNLASRNKLRSSTNSKKIKQLRHNLSINREETIKKFFFECVKGSPRELNDYKYLKKNFKLSSIPNNDILTDGLNHISDIDYFDDLKHTQKEVLVIYGEKDNLLNKISFSKFRQNKNIKLCSLNHIPHIPFISFKKEIYSAIKKFIEN